MRYRDYYRIMGLERSASAEDIKQAYRRLARKYHPDVSKEADAEARFKEVGEAYEVLKDPARRATYDRLGASWKAGQEFRPPPGWEREGGVGGGGSFSDFFETLFGRGAGPESGFRGRSNRPLRGKDINSKITITVEEACHGVRRTLKLRRVDADLAGRSPSPDRTLSVNIPRGVGQGQRIRLAGQGHPGSAGGEPGDLFLEIGFAPNEIYRVEGHDLYLDVPLAPWEAALGATLAIPTPEGAVELRIPAGAVAGRKLRLQGRGIPGKPPGDLFAVLQIVLPPADTAASKAFYERMARELPFDPRARFKL